MRIPIKMLLKVVSPVNRFRQSAYMRLVRSILKRSGIALEGTPHWIAPTVLFDISGPRSISIGEGVVISQNVSILTHDFSLDRYFASQSKLGPNRELFRSAPVLIGRYSFIGLGSILLPGVIIGEGSVVAAGSVVTKDVAPFSVVGGNPARLISDVPSWAERSSKHFIEQEKRK